MTTDTRATLKTAWAPAKVNLYLHVGPPGVGGLHPVDSVVMFADRRASDRITARVHPNLALTIEGEKARALKSAPQNLVIAAAAALRDACDHTGLGASLTLFKELPIASGIGGGSTDAAATLRLLNAMWRVGFSEIALERLAMKLGSDVPACVRCRPLLMQGMGERLSEVTAPDLPVVLVNPGAPLETRRVFERFDKLGERRDFFEVAPPVAANARGFAEALADYRNDLEPAAIALMSDIAKVLTALRAAPGCLIARMSGSGPTCFAAFADEASAEAAAAKLASDKKRWWVRASVLRGSASA